MLEVALLIVVITFLVNTCITGDEISSNKHRINDLQRRVLWLEHLCMDEDEELEENEDEPEEQDDEKDEDYTEGKKKKK